MSGQPIFGHKGRDRWICAVIAASGLSPIAVRAAVRLGIFFNCTTGQCNPGYARLAREVAVSRRSVIRAIAALEASGWIAVDRSDGHHDHKSEFTLLMPGERVTPDVTPTGDKDMSPVHASGRVTKNTGTGDKNRGERVTYAVTTKEPEEAEEPDERAYGPRSADDDRHSTFFNSANTSDDEAPNPRAPEGALVDQLASQHQLSSVVSAIGTLANMAAVVAAENSPQAGYNLVRRAYRQDRLGDERKAFFAYCSAVKARGLSAVLLGFDSMRLTYGDDVPVLADFLTTIERMP